jgi:hypothetical protein
VGQLTISRQPDSRICVEFPATRNAVWASLSIGDKTAMWTLSEWATYAFEARRRSSNTLR